MQKLPLLYIFLLILSIILTITSCEKHEIDKLPSETMSGRNTFGCLINGEAFTPEKTTWTDVALKGYYEDDYFLSIHVFNKDWSMKLIVLSPEQDSYYIFGKDIFGDKNKSKLNTPCHNDGVFLDNTKNNVLYISKFDLSKRICSGTFNLEFMGDICSEGNYIVSEGRFDINFSKY